MTEERTGGLAEEAREYIEALKKGVVAATSEAKELGVWPPTAIGSWKLPKGDDLQEACATSEFNRSGSEFVHIVVGVEGPNIGTLWCMRRPVYGGKKIPLKFDDADWLEFGQKTLSRLQQMAHMKTAGEHYPLLFY